MSDLTALIDGQVAAYRDRDLERFLSFYSPHVRIIDGDGRTIMDGIEQLREQYGASFAAHPSLTIEIAARMEIGDYVIDEEHVRHLSEPGGPGAPGQIRAVVVYKVAAGRIARVMMLS
jgi:hypothetical protein